MEGHMASDVNANRRRDFIGYGRQRPKVTWPNKAELAVSFVVNLEEGAEASLEDGQPSNDKLGEFVSSLPDGMRDLAMEQFHEYALRAGIWRILDLFERVTGERPLGFYSMWAPSLNTRRILKELGFIYDSNEYTDDLPYYDLP